jgi:hypothetical protein
VCENGIFVISLDFELYWGMRDKVTLEAYHKNLLGVKTAVPEMLNMFEQYGIHATWATVGMLFHETRSDFQLWAPPVLPQYQQDDLCPYQDIPYLGDGEIDDPFHFAPSLIKQIASSPHQEVGTHTYSHYYCLEAGQDKSSFHADLNTAKQLCIEYGLHMESIVFPRNQVNSDYLSVCHRLGIRAYRGTESCWLYAPSKEATQSQLKRGIRLLDAYLPLSGHNCSTLRSVPNGSLINVPSSRFLRPYSKRLRWLEPMRTRRILSCMTHAAKHGRLYHLWWHPHNFGADIAENLSFLRVVLEHFAVLRENYKMSSMNMREVAEFLTQGSENSEGDENVREGRWQNG